MNKKGAISILQIVILILGVVAISYAIGSEVKLVYADAGGAYGENNAGAGEAPPPGGKPIPAGTSFVMKSYAMKGLKAIAPEFAKSAPGFSTAGIIQGAGWALAVYGIVKMVGGWLGLNPGLTNALASAIAAGTFVYTGINAAFATGTTTAAGVTTGAGAFVSSPIAGFMMACPLCFAVGVAGFVFIMAFSSTKIKIINFTCNPWDAKTGGDDCEKCNKQGMLGCSEYQCRSLGQACQLLNPGTGAEKCAWVNRNDIKPPIIRPDSNVLPDDYQYSPDNTISPPDKGVKIIYKKAPDGCMPAFAPLKFGITVDEPAKCKVDNIRKDKFDNMSYYFGGDSMFKYNHTQIMALPGGNNLNQENLTIQNNGQFSLYTRCQDANGNYNIGNFVFKFCVQQGPDTTPPLIMSTSLLNGMPVAYNQSSIDLEVYVNEPAECKWSHLDQSFDDMPEAMSCSSSVEEINAQMLYTCTTTLTGIKSKEENKYYFRCKDQPLKTQDRNVNTQSYEFTLIGTQPLIIDSVSPTNGTTVKDSTETVKVTIEAKTSAGFDEGNSICYYSTTDSNYIAFYNTTSYEHSQELWLPSGNYHYFIKCVDLGGNSDTKEIDFNVESDGQAPVIVRAYHEESYLKLVTEEKAKCVYDTIDCSYSFDDGNNITTTDGLEHNTDWDTKTDLYIKCRDEYGNDPQPQNTCSIIVRAYDA